MSTALTSASRATICSNTTSGLAAIDVIGSHYRAHIAFQGATLLGWYPRSVDGREDESVVDGYQDQSELKSQNGVRSGILAPFTNRIVGGRYTFSDRHYQIMPVRQWEGEVYHGFARVRPFALKAIDVTEQQTKVEFFNEWSSVSEPGYPFSLGVTVAYLFHNRGVDLEISATNTGDTVAPYAAGWHPYFRLPGTASIDELELRIPSDRIVKTGEDLIPILSEDGVLLQSDASFRHWKTLGDRVMDCCFTELGADASGVITSGIRNATTGAYLEVWQERGHMHVFTGDTLGRDRRKSIALEPVEEITNALNIEQRRSSMALQPGETRVFRCGFSYFGGDQA